MSDTADEILPAHDVALGRVYDRWPGDSWRTADLAEVMIEAMGSVIEDMLQVLDDRRALAQFALMFGWSPAMPSTTDRHKATLELYLRWLHEQPAGSADVDNNPELINQMYELARAYERRQAAKPAVPANGGLILPT